MYRLLCFAIYVEFLFFQEKETKHEVGLEFAETLGVGINGAISKRVSISNELTAGFARIPTGEVTSFKPNCRETPTAFISIAYDNADGRQMLADNLPHGKSHAVVVTQKGGIVDALSPKEPWRAKDGKNHKPEDHEEKLLSLVGNKIIDVEKSLNDLGAWNVGTTMMEELLVYYSRVPKFNDELSELHEGMKKQIKKIKEEYWDLESKTKITVDDIKSYGENIKEAGSEYLDEENEKEGGRMSDFWNQISNMKDVQESLDEAIKQHNRIKHQIEENGERIELEKEEIQRLLNEAEEQMKKLKIGKAMSREDALNRPIPIGALVSTPVIGQATAACAGAQLGWDACVDNIPSGANQQVAVVAGAAAGTAGAVAGATISTLSMAGCWIFWTLAGLEWLKQKFRGFEERFAPIAKKMTSLEDLLSQIDVSLREILRLLKKARSSSENVVESKDEEKRKRNIMKVMEKADKLLLVVFVT